MPLRDVARPPARRGFTLIEVLVAITLLSLLAGALAPLGIRSLRAAQLEKTRTRMDSLLGSMAGDPAQGDFGYLGDMGRLPGSLADLNDPTGKPAFVVDTNDGMGYGWAGPYAPTVAAAGASVVDAWSLALQYDGVTAQLRSAGPDRQFATADDLVRPFVPFGTVGNLVVTVLGVPNTGDPAEQLDASRADVFVASSVAGVRGEQLMGGGGPFSANGLHLGLHGLRVVGAGSYSGAAVVRDVVSIKRGSTHRTLVLAQP
jgi:prepilin-type N-terminal cleavage/methylation domain-containing protein